MDYIVCRNCCLPFDCPRVLPCGHCFCLECLQFIASKKSFDVANGSSKCFFCPLCRQLCEFDPEVGVDAFKANPLVERLVEVVFFRSLMTCQKCERSEGKKTRSRWSFSNGNSHCRASANEVLGCCFRCQSLYCRNCGSDHGSPSHDVSTVEELRNSLFEILKGTVTHDIRNGVRNLKKDKMDIKSRDANRFEPTILAVGPNDELVLVSRRGDMKFMTSKGEVIKTLTLSHVQLSRFHYRGSISSCHNYGNESPCRNVAIWSVAFNSTGHVVCTAQHRCIEPSSCSSVPIAFVQSANCQPIGECILHLNESLAKQVSMKPRVVSPSQIRPRSVIAMKNDCLLISDVGLHCIHVFDSTYRHVFSFGGLKKKNDKTHLNEPICLTAMFRTSFFAVVDFGERKIKVFSMSEDYKVRFSMEFTSSSEKFRPHQMACDANDNFFLADRSSRDILVFNSSGQYVMNLTNLGLPFEAGDVLLASMRRGPAFLFKCRHEKALWHLSCLEWSLVKMAPRGTGKTDGLARTTRSTTPRMSSKLCSIL